MQFTNPQPAFSACSAYQQAAYCEPTGR
jgi:hypothetical protein